MVTLPLCDLFKFAIVRERLGRVEQLVEASEQAVSGSSCRFCRGAVLMATHRKPQLLSNIRNARRSMRIGSSTPGSGRKTRTKRGKSRVMAKSPGQAA